MVALPSGSLQEAGDAEVDALVLVLSVLETWSVHEENKDVEDAVVVLSLLVECEEGQLLAVLEVSALDVVVLAVVIVGVGAFRVRGRGDEATHDIERQVLS